MGAVSVRAEDLEHVFVDVAEWENGEGARVVVVDGDKLITFEASHVALSALAVAVLSLQCGITEVKVGRGGGQEE